MAHTVFRPLLKYAVLQELIAMLEFVNFAMRHRWILTPSVATLELVIIVRCGPSGRKSAISNGYRVQMSKPKSTCPSMHRHVVDH